MELVRAEPEEQFASRAGRQALQLPGHTRGHERNHGAPGAHRGVRGRDKRWRPRRVPPRSAATRWRISAWSAPALTMGVCGAFALLVPFMLSLKARLTFDLLCERMPAAQATLKKRADAEARKLSVKPASLRIREVSEWLHRLAAFSSSAEEVARRIVEK